MISHPEKVLFPEDGITKGELAAYYDAIAPIMLPHVRGRPVTMERYPSGIGAGGFMQKDVSRGFPAWLERVEVAKKGGTVHHPLANDARSLLWLANQNCVTIHVWTSRVPTLLQPDLCVFDLDPSVDDPELLRRGALALRDAIDDLALPSWVKTSGAKGYHVVVPLHARLGFDDVARFAHGVGARLVSRHPGDFTQEFSKADRRGRIYVDTGRNGYSATFAAPYTVRARRGAPVSAPCTWEEIASRAVHPQSFRLRSMAARIDRVGDLWSGLRRHPRALTRALKRLERQEVEGDAPPGRVRRAGARATSIRMGDGHGEAHRG
jgi:bifunctional non-homologous end joining protein LigD